VPLEPQERLDRIVREVAQNMVTEVCSFYLLRPDGVLELFATIGLNPSSVHHAQLQLGQGLVGTIAASAQALNLSDAQSHPAFAYLPETGEEMYQSFLGVPILRKGRTLGVLVVQNRTIRVYRDDEIEALETTSMVLGEMIASGDLLHLRYGTREAVAGAASPFKYEWSSGGKVTLADPGGMDRIFVPSNRSPEDGARRLDAARQLASDLHDALKSGESDGYQVRETYGRGLSLYLDRLPRLDEGNIYLADFELRNLRDDLEDDLKHGVDDRFARRLGKLIEQHYGLRPYFPDLMTFYDDVKRGKLSEPPPLQAMEKLEGVVKEFTPDVFESRVSEYLGDLEPTGTSSHDEKLGSSTDAVTSVILPPDPISGIDLERTRQHAKGGALNQIWSVLRRVEDGAKNIERAEKAMKTYEKYVEPLLDWLNKIT
jgi:putative methionine-R-sulfoxide reductase with GAF domain